MSYGSRVESNVLCSNQLHSQKRHGAILEAFRNPPRFLEAIRTPMSLEATGAACVGLVERDLFHDHPDLTRSGYHEGADGARLLICECAFIPHAFYVLVQSMVQDPLGVSTHGMETPCVPWDEGKDRVHAFLGDMSIFWTCHSLEPHLPR